MSPEKQKHQKTLLCLQHLNLQHLYNLFNVSQYLVLGVFFAEDVQI